MADTKTTAPAAPAKGPVSETPEQNPKVVAQAGTVPPSMQAPGPSLPHPSVDDPARTPSDDPKVEEAKARALNPDSDEPFDLKARATNIGEPYGDPIQCIARRKFIGERGETVKPGATYYYTRRKDMPWPDYLEPVSKAVASKVRQELADRQSQKADQRAKKRDAREFFDTIR